MGISEGDTVSVHYTGKLDDGNVFDTSEGRDPLTWEVGSGQLIPGFDTAVIGKDVGDKITTTIPAAEAYGDRDENMIQELPRERLQGTDLEVGQVLGLQDQDGKAYQALVTALADETVTLDFNHFLAGKALTFDIEVVAIA